MHVKMFVCSTARDVELLETVSGNSQIASEVTEGDYRWLFTVHSLLFVAVHI